MSTHRFSLQNFDPLTVGPENDAGLAHVLAAADRVGQLAVVNTQLQAAYEEQKTKAERDSLTGLYNRGHVEDAIKIHYASERRREHEQPGYKSPGSCFVILDVDLFKRINDNHGHQAGDEVLIRIADILSTSAKRESDIVGRWGGEEFVMFLPGTTPEAAMKVADRARMHVEGTDIFDPASERNMKSTISGGVVQIDPTDITGSIARADQALYQSKENGRNQISLAGTV